MPGLGYRGRKPASNRHPLPPEAHEGESHERKPGEQRAEVDEFSTARRICGNEKAEAENEQERATPTELEPPLPASGAAMARAR